MWLQQTQDITFGFFFFVVDDIVVVVTITVVVVDSNDRIELKNIYIFYALLFSAVIIADRAPRNRCRICTKKKERNKNVICYGERNFFPLFWILRSTSKQSRNEKKSRKNVIFVQFFFVVAVVVACCLN